MSLLGDILSGLTRALGPREGECACPHCRSTHTETSPHRLTYTDGHRCLSCFREWTTPQEVSLSVRLYGQMRDHDNLRPGLRRIPLPGMSRAGW